jgi:hypothetical protein
VLNMVPCLEYILKRKENCQYNESQSPEDRSTDTAVTPYVTDVQGTGKVQHNARKIT